jgi:hypothetical protein
MVGKVRGEWVWEGVAQMARRQEEGRSQRMIEGMECVEGDHAVVPVEVAQDQKVTTSGHQEGQIRGRSI